jgi:hypothetical protein
MFPAMIVGLRMNDVNLESNSIWEKYQKKENLPNEYNDIIEKIKSKENPNFLDPLKVLGPITYKENEYSFEEKSKDNSSKDSKVTRILFTGFNPSFPIKHYLKCEGLNGEKPHEFFRYYNDKKKWKNRIADVAEVDYSLRNKLSEKKENYYTTYFKPISRFICDCFGMDYNENTSIENLNEKIENENIKHVHIDPFFIRGTNQKQAEKILFKDNELNEFGKSQFKLFEKMIESYKPTAIIILNASASHLLSRRWGNDDFKTSFKANIKNLDPIKVFCGGMLSGGRAMDNYSKRRFAKEIRKNLKRG